MKKTAGSRKGYTKSSVAKKRAKTQPSEQNEASYEVERILGVKRDRRGDVIAYKVSWKGYDSSHDSFVKVQDAVGCERLIRQFLARSSI